MMTSPDKPAKIEALIKQAEVCRLGINDGTTPYVVPLSFGYRDNTLYFHSGPKGKKLDLLKENPDVCFEFDRVTKVMEAENPCSWDIGYQSIIGTGKAEFLETPEDKIKGLEAIVAQYSDRPMKIPESGVKNTVVFRVNITGMAHKQNSV